MPIIPSTLTCKPANSWSINIETILSVANYAIASTESAVFIVGGGGGNILFPQDEKVVKYEDDIWSVVGDLQHGRYAHSSITFRSETMILGGGGTYEDLGVPMETEIWTFDTETTSKINPILPYNEYLGGTVLFLVDNGFCKKNKL